MLWINPERHVLLLVNNLYQRLYKFVITNSWCTQEFPGWNPDWLQAIGCYHPRLNFLLDAGCCCSLIVARYFLFVTFSQLLWAIAQLLVTHVTLIYLDELFIFSLLVLLKEIRTRGESKISSGCILFRVNQENQEAGVGPRFPSVTPVVENS